MIRNTKGFLDKYGLFIIAAIVFMLTAMVNIHVRHYGDDFFYTRFTTGDLEYFFARHVDHYLHANGRLIVHVLATLFLGIPIYVWSFVNSFMMAGIVYFGAKIANDVENKERLEIYSAVIIGLFIVLLDPSITRQSIYWLTGSFNYLYPMFLLLFYWYMLRRAIKQNRITWFVVGLAFLSAATVEQSSLMTFGLTFLTLIEIKWMQKKRVDKIFFAALMVTLFGVITVLFAPGVFERVAVEEHPTNDLISLIKYNVITQGNSFIYSKIMAPYNLLAMITALGVILNERRYLFSKWKWIEIIGLICAISSCFGWLYIMSPGVNIKTNNQFMLLLSTGYIYVLVYAAFLVLKHRLISYQTLPILTLILCFGSQIMLLISPVYGPRNLLFAIFMLALYTASLMPKLNLRGISLIGAFGFCMLFNFWILSVPIIAFLFIFSGDYNKKLNYVKTGVVLGYSTIAIVSLTVFIPTIKGYSSNAFIFDKNLKLAEVYRSENLGGELIQYKLPKEMYAWVMPYHNPYYERYYNLYLGRHQKEEIEWQDYKKINR